MATAIAGIKEADLPAMAADPKKLLNLDSRLQGREITLQTEIGESKIYSIIPIAADALGELAQLGYYIHPSDSGLPIGSIKLELKEGQAAAVIDYKGAIEHLIDQAFLVSEAWHQILNQPAGLIVKNVLLRNVSFLSKTFGFQLQIQDTSKPMAPKETVFLPEDQIKNRRQILQETLLKEFPDQLKKGNSPPPYTPEEPSPVNTPDLPPAPPFSPPVLSTLEEKPKPEKVKKSPLPPRTLSKQRYTKVPIKNKFSLKKIGKSFLNCVCIKIPFFILGTLSKAVFKFFALIISAFKTLISKNKKADATNF